jgi:hypothetical protein
MGARWYDAQIGRWISADTIIPDFADPQSHNRFAYVLGNPLRHVDTDGHRPREPELIQSPVMWDPPDDDDPGDGVLPPWEVDEFDTFGFRVSGGGGAFIIGVEVKVELILDPQDWDNAGLFFGIDLQFGLHEGLAVGGGIVEVEGIETLDDYPGWDWSIAGEAASPVGGLEVDFEQDLGSPGYSWYISPVADIGEELKLATGPGWCFELARYQNGIWSPPTWFRRMMGEKQ